MKDGSCEVITGSLGAGKSQYAVEIGMDHLSIGGTCITNIPIDPVKIGEWMKEEFGRVFDPSRLELLKQATIDKFYNFAKRGNDKHNVLMILDEAALDLNARDWSKRDDEMFNFVVLVRKMGIRLILVAQDNSDLDKQLRKKFQWETHCRSLKQFMPLGLDIPVPVFVRVRYWLAVGQKPMSRGFKFSWKSPAWGMYDSHALHGEKAMIFGALDQSSDEDLKRVEYDPVPYYVSAALAGLAASVTTSLCL